MTNAFEIFNLQASDSDEVESSSSDSESEPVAKKGRGKAKPYDIVQNFQTEQLFNQWWETEKSRWTLLTTLHNKNQMVRVWWCKHNEQYGGHVGQKCEARLRVCYSREDTSVHVEQLRVVHDHTAAKALDKIPEDLKARIKQLTAEGVKPKRIHTIFTKESLDPIPSLTQIQNFVGNQRTPASKPFTDHQMRTYCEEHSAVPDDRNKTYVLAYEINGTDSFFVMWTTPQLLERQLTSDQLQADATSSTNWHNYPLLVLGHSDYNRHFVPTLLAVGKSENKYVYHSMFRTLRELGYRPAEVLGDGADAITSATKEHFPGAKRIMCAVHAIRRVDKHSTKIPAHLRKRIREEVDFLARTMQAFEPFLQDVGAILNYWSIHLRDLPNVPDIPLAEMKKALELVAECTAPPGGTPRRYYLRLAGTGTYVFASSEARFANVGELFDAYQRSFSAGPSTWEEYAEWRFEVHRVYPSTKFKGPFYECSCQKGCKKNVCKHAVMVMCTLEKIYEYSAEALAKPMKHSRRSSAKQIGRPALSQKQNRFAAAD